MIHYLDMDKSYKIRDVCLLEERDRTTGRLSLYGVWNTEAEGRADYGDESDDYELICTTVPMWGRGG